MAAQMYYAQYHTPLAERKARVGAVLWNSGKKELVETNPCGTTLEVSRSLCFALPTLSLQD